MKDQSKDYWCQNCSHFVQGVGNWGGCIGTAPDVGEVDGLHIHAKSSCKYWAKLEGFKYPDGSEINPKRFSKKDALYGCTDTIQASPIGFSCKNCEHWMEESKGCVRFEGQSIDADDCSDGWQPNDKALQAAKEYEDQKSPASKEDAERLAVVYGPAIGEELTRSASEKQVFEDIELKDDELEELVKATKAGDKEVTKWYEARKNIVRREPEPTT